MQFFSFALPLLAVCVSLVVAQTATAATTYSCQAQNILDTCLATEKLQMTNCDQSSYDCLCTASQNVLTCYNNCPGHPGQSAAQGTKTSYCNAAAQLSSLTATATSSSTMTLVSSSTSQTTSTPTRSATSTTTSGSSTAKESKGAAAGLVVEGGSLLAAMLVGLVAL